LVEPLGRPPLARYDHSSCVF